MEQQQESEAKECSRCKKSLSPQSTSCPVCGTLVQATPPENAQAQQQLPQDAPAPSPRKPSQPQQKVISIYFSYAHEDKALLDKLEKHLIDLKYSGFIKTWHAQEVSAGQNYVEQVSTQLDQANIILLLISAYFMASPYCYEIEMTRAFERHKRKEVDIIPILLRPVLFDNAPFAHLNKLPKNGKFVTRWSNRDSAFLDIAKEIQQIVKSQQIVSNYPAPPTKYIPPLPLETGSFIIKNRRPSLPPIHLPDTTDTGKGFSGLPTLSPPQRTSDAPFTPPLQRTSDAPFTPPLQRQSDAPTAGHIYPAPSIRESNRLSRRRTWFIEVSILFLVLLILIYHAGILLFLRTYGLLLTLVLAGLLALFGIVSIGRRIARRRAQQEREAADRREEANWLAEAMRREDEIQRRAKAEKEELQRQAEIPGYEYYKTAVQMYQDALKKNAADAVACRGLGNAYLGMHAYPEARQAFLRALWFAVEQPACFVGLGDAYAGTKSFREALAEYEKALEIDPSYAPAYAHLHDFFIEWERPEKASEVAKRARQYGYEIED